MTEKREDFVELLYRAFQNQDSDLIKYVIVEGKRKNFYPLFLTSRKGEYAITKFLIENGVNIHEGKEWALFLACKFKNFHIVELLLQNGAVPSVNENYPLVLAAREGNMKILQLLIQYGADIHDEDEMTLMVACKFGRYEIVKFLVEKGANFRTNSDQALSLAFYNGHYEVVKFLVEKGAPSFILQSSERCKKYFLFCEKMKNKRQVWAVNKIGSWWIPICYNLNLECGKRMMERSWKRVEDMYKEIQH